MKTLATEAGVTRAALYGTYLLLKEEFERRRDPLRQAGVIADPRDAQIDRLKQQVVQLTDDLAAAKQYTSNWPRFAPKPCLGWRVSTR